MTGNSINQDCLNNWQANGNKFFLREAFLSGINFHGTTIVAVRRDGKVAIAGDGQVTLGNTVMKKGAVKVRKMRDGSVLCGFAGSTADAMTLFDKFESKLEAARGNITKAVKERAKEGG